MTKERKYQVMDACAVAVDEYLTGAGFDGFGITDYFSGGVYDFGVVMDEERRFPALYAVLSGLYGSPLAGKTLDGIARAAARFGYMVKFDTAQPIVHVLKMWAD